MVAVTGSLGHEPRGLEPDAIVGEIFDAIGGRSLTGKNRFIVIEREAIPRPNGQCGPANAPLLAALF